MPVYIPVNSSLIKFQSYLPHIDNNLPLYQKSQVTSQIKKQLLISPFGHMTSVPSLNSDFWISWRVSTNVSTKKTMYSMVWV